MKEIKPKDKERREGIEKDLEMNVREKLEFLALLRSPKLRDILQTHLACHFLKYQG